MICSIRSLISLSVTASFRSAARFVVLRALDEEGDGLRLERLVLGRAGLREGPLLRLVRLLRPRQQRVELGLRDRGPVDDGDGVRRDALVVAAAAAGGRDEHGEGDEDDRLRGEWASWENGSLVGVAEEDAEGIDEAALNRSCDVFGFETYARTPCSRGRTGRDYSIGQPERPLEILGAERHLPLGLRVDDGVGGGPQRAELARAERRAARPSRARRGRRGSRHRSGRASASPPGSGRGSRPARAAGRSGPRRRPGARAARRRARRARAGGAGRS